MSKTHTSAKCDKLFVYGLTSACVSGTFGRPPRWRNISQFRVRPVVGGSVPHTDPSLPTKLSLSSASGTNNRRRALICSSLVDARGDVGRGGLGLVGEAGSCRRGIFEVEGRVDNVDLGIGRREAFLTRDDESETADAANEAVVDVHLSPQLPAHRLPRKRCSRSHYKHFHLQIQPQKCLDWSSNRLLKCQEFDAPVGPFIEDFHQCVSHGFYTSQWQEQLYCAISLMLMFVLPLVILVSTYVSTVCTIA
ncbi:hypothetical protein B566_EDAN018555, partial [Ephemera danica]